MVIKFYLLFELNPQNKQEIVVKKNDVLIWKLESGNVVL